TERYSRGPAATAAPSHGADRRFESCREYCGVDWSWLPARSHKPSDAGSNPASATALAEYANAAKRPGREEGERAASKSASPNETIGLRFPSLPQFVPISCVLRPVTCMILCGHPNHKRPCRAALSSATRVSELAGSRPSHFAPPSR